MTIAVPSLRSLHGARVLGLGLFLLVAFLVVYPIALLVYQSFQVGTFGTPTTWGFDNWRAALGTPAMREEIGRAHV